MKRKLGNQFSYNKDTQMLYFIVNSTDPNPKGVRATAQKWCKSKGVFDAMCSLEEITPTPDNRSYVRVRIFSPSLMIKKLFTLL